MNLVSLQGGFGHHCQDIVVLLLDLLDIRTLVIAFRVMGLPVANLLDSCLLNLRKGKPFVIVQGIHHGRGILRSDVIILHLDSVLLFLFELFTQD
jgi:hypothetical protein